MDNFLDTVETIGEGLGFKQFGGLHLAEIAICVISIAIASIVYRKLDDEKALKFRRTLAWLIVADEIWKMFWLTIGHRYTVDYLPFHLCSINIFVILYHAYKPNKAIDNYLYAISIPGALMAILFPSWTALPLLNFMHLHSETIHIMLIMYPVMLLCRGDIKPELKAVPKSLLVLFALAGFALVVNLVLGTNFMFIMYAKPGNPLYLFKQWTGSHLVGFPVLMALIMFIMYFPIVLKNRKKAS